LLQQLERVLLIPSLTRVQLDELDKSRELQSVVMAAVQDRW